MRTENRDKGAQEKLRGCDVIVRVIKTAPLVHINYTLEDPHTRLRPAPKKNQSLCL